MDAAGAISQIESGGNYGILGAPTSSGDRAYGAYQIMGNNIGPWTKEVLGAPMSPQEFLASPQAQDAVFQTKFGQYAQKYGPEGAARAWFAGPGNMNNPNASDGNTTVGQYADKFRSLMAPPLPSQNVGSLPATPQQMPAQAPPIAGPAPQQPQPQQQQAPPQGGDISKMLQQLMQPAQPMQMNQLSPFANRSPGFSLARAYQKIPLPPGFTGFQS